MSTTWVLVIALGCSGWGCGSFGQAEFPDKASCFEALREVKIDLNSGASVAYCKPQKVVHDR